MVRVVVKKTIPMIRSHHIKVERKIFVQKPIIVDEIFNLRMRRIKMVEEPLLKKRGFDPLDRKLSTWSGFYKGYRVQIFFPDDYPAVPFSWFWEDIPEGFPHIIDNQLCVEVLLNSEAWVPDITVETIFEALDSHWYFRGRRQ